MKAINNKSFNAYVTSCANLGDSSSISLFTERRNLRQLKSPCTCSAIVVLLKFVIYNIFTIFVHELIVSFIICVIYQVCTKPTSVRQTVNIYTTRFYSINNRDKSF